MRKGRFTEEQIIGILKEQEAGAKTQELCRRHGISGTTFFKWKAKFGGLEASDAKRLRSLEDENRRLKKLLAEQLTSKTVMVIMAVGIVPRKEAHCISVFVCEQSRRSRDCRESSGASTNYSYEMTSRRG